MNLPHYKGNSLSDELIKMDNKRIERQEKSYYYYAGDSDAITEYLEAVIIRTLGEEIVKDKEWVYDWVNITEKIINRLSVVYKEPAEREIVENEKLTEYLEELLPQDINTKNKKAHRFAKLFNTSLTQVVFDRDKGLDLRTEPSFKYKVEVSDEDYYKIEKVSYEKEFKNDKGEKEVYDVVWTKDRHYKVDSEDKESPVGDNIEMINPYGIIPFAVLRLNDGENFWGIGLEDIINVNEVVNFLLTVLLNDSIILGSAGTLFTVNLDLHKKAQSDNSTTGQFYSGNKSGVRKARVGRRHPIVVENARADMQEPRVEYVSTEPLIIEIQNNIDYRIKQVAVLKGLNPNTIISSVKDTSDYQKMMDAVEQLEIRRDDIEPCRNYERELFEIIRAVNNVAVQDGELKTKFGLQTIPGKAELSVDFAEIEVEKTTEELWKDREEREKRNMASAVDWLMEDNPDLTEEEAKEILAANREVNTTVGSSKPRSLFETLTNNNEEEVND